MLLVIDDILETEFEVDTRSYYDNLGKFTSDKGKVGVKTHRVADNNFYQDYSYVIESESGIEEWRDLIKDSVHPAGFKMFGELNLDLMQLFVLMKILGLLNYHNLISGMKMKTL